MDLDKIVGSRLDSRSIGFGAEIVEKNKENTTQLLKNVMPEDFVKFGLIPELIGRIPIVVSLEELDEDALVRILTEPKNSIIKQYSKLFAMDDVKLTVEKGALRAMAQESIKRNTGARGLRSIMEQTVLGPMYEVPSDKSIKECIVTKDSVIKGEPPKFVHKQDKKKAVNK